MDLLGLYKICEHPETCDDVAQMKNLVYDFLKEKKHQGLTDGQLGVWMLHNNIEDASVMRQVLEKIKPDVIIDILVEEKTHCLLASNMLGSGYFNEGINYVFKNCFYFNHLPDQYTHYKEYGFHMTKSKLVKMLRNMCVFKDDEIKEHEEFFIYIHILKTQLDNIINAIEEHKTFDSFHQVTLGLTDWEKRYFVPMLQKYAE